MSIVRSFTLPGTPLLRTGWLAVVVIWTELVWPGKCPQDQFPGSFQSELTFPVHVNPGFIVRIAAELLTGDEPQLLEITHRYDLPFFELSGFVRIKVDEVAPL